MTQARDGAPAIPEFLDIRPRVNVADSEYRRLLGYPRGHAPAERALELMDRARREYAACGRPFIYMRQAEIGGAGQFVRVDGREFRSARLGDLLAGAGARRAMLVAVGAGGACDERAGQLWAEAKPDEYFFLEVFGSAVVEHLVSLANARICALAERDGQIALPHYSPGYTGWDVADQNSLFEIVTRGMSRPLPEPLAVMASGMLRPKKSLLAVVGLAAPRPGMSRSPQATPCQTCSFAPCQYRRAPHLQAPGPVPGTRAPGPRATAKDEGAPLTRDARYSLNVKALRKWAGERVFISRSEDGSVEARFRFDGTTCSNLGRPLSFDYVVGLGPPRDGYTIRNAECRPAPGDTGHASMCAYLSDAGTLMEAVRAERPLLGRPLDDVLAWAPPASPCGCLCEAASRTHKWVLALESIHYTLANTGAGAPAPLA